MKVVAENTDREIIHHKLRNAEPPRKEVFAWLPIEVKDRPFGDKRETKWLCTVYYDEIYESYYATQNDPEELVVTFDNLMKERDEFQARLKKWSDSYDS